MNTQSYWQDPINHTGDRVPFLIHSLTNHFELIAEIARISKPRYMLEIGSESGGSTLQLIELAEQLGSTLTTIETVPDAMLQEARRTRKHYHLIGDKSLDVLPNLPHFPEITVIDGDHNYYTVYNELTKLIAHRKDQNFAIIMHDVGFPWARRDLYYKPSDIPIKFLHPHSFDDGVLPGVKHLVKDAGFSGVGEFAAALEEGGPRNGVLTAIEDFLKEHKDISFQKIDAVFGLGILYAGTPDFEKAIAGAITPYQKQIVTKLERNRMANYLRLIEVERLNGELFERLAETERRLARQTEATQAARDEIDSVLSHPAYRLYSKSRKMAKRLLKKPPAK